MPELRCDWKMHGKIDGNVMEVKCQSSRCGAKSGVVVLHYFDLENGKLIDTKVFQDANNAHNLFTNNKEKAS